MAAAMDPVLAQFAFYATVCVLKMMFMALLTARTRFRTMTFANKEDAAMPNAKVAFNEDAVERVRRNHLNDLENIPAFVLVGLLYSLTGPNPYYAALHFRAFTASRFLHTIAYQLPLPQPARALAFFVGVAATVSMAVQVLMATNF